MKNFMPFEKNIFINCPFDIAYRPLLRPILFTVLSHGLTPRIALERSDSAETRISKIIALIRESQFGIHDLSRLQANQPGEFYRLNMPFELGLDIGCRNFGEGRLKEKRCLVLEKERFRYQAALSDLSGSDISSHDDQPDQIVSCVRTWIYEQTGINAGGPSKIWGNFNEFMAKNYDEMTANGFSPKDIENSSIPELIENMKKWISDRG